MFHVLKICGVIQAHKQTLVNHDSVSSSLKAMSAAVHEAEILLNAAPTVIDPDDPDAQQLTCLSYEDPRVAVIGERGRNRGYSISEVVAIYDPIESNQGTRCLSIEVRWSMERKGGDNEKNSG